MAGTTQYVPFATASGALVLAPTTYAADSQLASGAQPGIARVDLNNTTLRQCSMAAAALTQFIANELNIAVNDDGNVANLVTNLTNAINAEISAFVTPAIAAALASIPAEPIVPQMTIKTSGSGTYTTPIGARVLHVRMVGPGGGGGGGGTASAGVGGTGTATTFGTSLLTANSGTGGLEGVNAQNAVTGGGGGSASGGALNISGGSGIPYYGQTGTAGGSGGLGAPSAFGGAANAPGSGGSGGNVNSASYTAPGGGGGAGGYLEAWITSPAASYSYSVGSGGSAGVAGTNGYAGTVGAPGLIIIEAF